MSSGRRVSSVRKACPNEGVHTPGFPGSIRLTAASNGDFPDFPLSEGNTSDCNWFPTTRTDAARSRPRLPAPSGDGNSGVHSLETEGVEDTSHELPPSITWSRTRVSEVKELMPVIVHG